MGFFKKFKRKIGKKKQMKRKQMADNKKRIIEHCITHLDGKCSAVMKEATALEEKARALKEEARRLRDEGASKDVINHLRDEYMRVSHDCDMQKSVCEGFRSVLYALYDLFSLVKVLYTKEWYSYFVELPDTELSQAIMNENGEFAMVARQINEKYEMLLDRMADQMADAKEYTTMKDNIKKESDYRKKLFEETNDNNDNDDWLDDEDVKNVNADQMVNPIPNQPVAKANQNRA